MKKKIEKNEEKSDDSDKVKLIYEENEMSLSNDGSENKVKTITCKIPSRWSKPIAILEKNVNSRFSHLSLDVKKKRNIKSRK